MDPGGWPILGGVLIIGAVIGATLASRVQMTSMPELVAILHSFVGLAAVLVGVRDVSRRHAPMTSAERTPDPSHRDLHRRMHRFDHVHGLGDRVSQASWLDRRQAVHACPGRHDHQSGDADRDDRSRRAYFAMSPGRDGSNPYLLGCDDSDRHSWAFTSSWRSAGRICRSSSRCLTAIRAGRRPRRALCCRTIC